MAESAAAVVTSSARCGCCGTPSSSDAGPETLLDRRGHRRPAPSRSRTNVAWKRCRSGRWRAELGVGTMTLYRYIPSKAELLDLMLDRVNQPGFDELPVGWRPAMEVIGRDVWRLYTTHRWLPQVDQARPVLGPNAVHALDLVMGALRGASSPTRRRSP